MASWAPDHVTLSRIHHDDILRHARQDQLFRLATRGKRSRPRQALDFLVAHRPRRTARPAHVTAPRVVTTRA